MNCIFELMTKKVILIDFTGVRNSYSKFFNTAKISAHMFEKADIIK